MSSEEDEEDEVDENILANEIESWRGFEYALREPNATLFNKMLNECLENEEYSKACNTKGSHQSAESLFMVLIFQQQKMIRKLIERIGSNQNSEK